MSLRLSVLVFLLLSLIPRTSHAFPEMVRHNYPNCISCHVSPNGGGVLNSYGRESSSALLSTWGQNNEWESKPAWGVVPLPTFVDAMGMYRGVYAYQNTPYISQGQYIYMQGDLEADLHYKSWYLDGALGYSNPPGANSIGDHMIARRYYLNYRPEDDLSFRVGRFYPTVGIETPDHVIPTKKDLGWDQSQETINAEAAYIGETYNVFATVDFGRPDEPAQHRETGFALTPSMSIADHYKVGFSYFYGNAQTTTRNVVGPWGILGFTPHLFLLTEWDFQREGSKTDSFSPHWGAVNYQKLDYEIVQGLHVYVTQDYSKLDFGDPASLTNSFGGGVQFFPRPHFELNLSWQKLHSVVVSPQYTDFAWLMINIYI